MTEKTLTRRSFVAASAGVAALAGAGAAATGVIDFADARAPEAIQAYQVHTTCDGCGNKCGIVAWVREGKVWRVQGEPGHPSTMGDVCGRGQGLVSLAYAEDRLTKPMKNEGGKLVETTWDEALSAIGSAFKSAGDKLGVFQARGNCEPYVKRFAYAMGSANYYTDAAVHDLDISAAIECVSGAYPAPDTANATYAVLLDKSTYDGGRPQELVDFSERHYTGEMETVLVDSRMSSFGRVASEWVPIIPGTELAFLLGIAGEIVRNDGYNEEFVNANANGFEEFAAAVRDYDLAWASEKTGIADSKIAEVASKLVANAPHCFVDLPWAGTFGAGYENSFDVCRTVYLINAMLGNFNQVGGWIFGNTPYVADAALEAAGIPAVAAPESPAAGMDASDLGANSCVAAIDAIDKGEITAALFVETNPLLDWPARSRVESALEKLDCVVVCDQFVTETAEKADYVLPLCSYLECDSTPTTTAAATSVASMRNQVVERMYTDTKSIDETIVELAKACGVGDSFNFSLDDYNRAWCTAAGVNYTALAQGGTTTAGSSIVIGSVPYMRTESGKIDFASDKAEAAGLGRVPEWSDPAVSASEATPRLMVGEINTQSASYTLGADKLMAVADMYGLDRVWLNDSRAKELGIEDGNRVKLSTSEGSIEGRVKVTKLISPYAVWVPSHFGSQASAPADAKGFGIAPKQLIPLAQEPGTKAAMMNEVVASVVKVGD